MGDKNQNKFVALLAVLCLVVGLFAGATLFSTKTTVPGEIVTKEIVKEVKVTQLVNVSVPLDYLKVAQSDFLKAVEDGEDQAGNDNDVLGVYDFDEVSVKKVYKDYSIEFSSDQYEVSFSIDLKFKESGESSVVNHYNVTVIYEEGEDTIVQIA